jgi:hypothetical protein
MNKERLLKLADHLLNGELGHREFDFTTYNNSIGQCGTRGCAIGECPIVFPEDWVWRYDSYCPSLINKDILSAAACAREYFEISDDEYSILFIPQFFEEKDRPGLYYYASKEEVANQIIDFVNGKLII